MIQMMCDRCKSAIGKPPLERFLTNVRAKLDLCDKCMTALDAWVKAGPQPNDPLTDKERLEAARKSVRPKPPTVVRVKTPKPLPPKKSGQ